MKQLATPTPAQPLNPPETGMPSRRVKRLFILLLILVPLFSLVLLETSLRLFDYGEDLSLFVSVPDEQSQQLGVNLNIGRRYYYYANDNFDPKPQKDLFLKQKPENGYRIFVLGASTTVGFPFGTSISFSRFLHQRLADVFPERHIEVINTAITSVNSYSLLDFVDEILEQQPDAILLYAGQNEYLGPFGPVAQVTLGRSPWMVRSILKLQRYKTFLLVRDLFSPLIRQMANNITPASIQGTSGSVDSSFIANTMVPFDSELYFQGLNQFESNLRLIIKQVGKQGVPLILSEIVSNLRDQAPFPTFEADSLSPARLKFLEARALEASGNYDEARLAYYLAKDLDPVPFRSPEAFNRILDNLAQEFELPLVRMRSYFESISPHGLIGNNIMLDHVHPTKEGYFLMADAFYHTMEKEGLIESTWPSIPSTVVRAYLDQWPFTPLDSVYAHLVIENLISGWPFKVSNFSSIYANESVLDKFRPESIVDSIGLKTYTIPGYSLQQGHLELAQYYEKQGNYEAALTEYAALIASIPFIDNFYQNAVELLMDNQDYYPCRKLLLNGVKFNPSANMFKWLGQTELVMELYRDAILNLERSLALNTGDLQVQRNLIRAYATVGEFESANKLVRDYKGHVQTTVEIKDLTTLVKQTELRYKKAIDWVKRAKELLRQKDYNAAIRALQMSVKQLETHEASQLMGHLLVSAGQHEKAGSYLERARSRMVQSNPELLDDLIQVYTAQDKRDLVVKIYDELLQDFPEYQRLAHLQSSLTAQGYTLE